MKNSILLILLLFAIGLTTISCEEGGEDPQPEINSGITMALKTTGGDETEFIVNQKNIMEGEVSAVGTGYEQLGWKFYYQVGSTLFSSGYSDDNECTAYVSNDAGTIVKGGAFVFENALESFGHSDDEKTFLAMEISRAGFADRKLHFVDVNSVTVDKIIGTKIFESKEDSLVAWPTALQVRGDKLFIPFHKMDAKGFFTTPEPNAAYVAVFPYPEVTAEPEKIISDPRTSNIGVNGAATGLIETDNGDLYSFSCGTEMAGFAPAATKPSGILRIKSGTTEFDPDYFFNIEEATGGGSIFWFDYVGNGKAIARILLDDDGGAWGAFGRDPGSFNQKLVIINLANKTITDVANVPVHAKRYSSPVTVVDGKVYESIETATEAHVYQIDIATATGTKGATIIGKTIKGFYEL